MKILCFFGFHDFGEWYVREVDDLLFGRVGITQRHCWRCAAVEMRTGMVKI